MKEAVPVLYFACTLFAMKGTASAIFVVPVVKYIMINFVKTSKLSSAINNGTSLGGIGRDIRIKALSVLKRHYILKKEIPCRVDKSEIPIQQISEPFVSFPLGRIMWYISSDIKA